MRTLLGGGRRKAAQAAKLVLPHVPNIVWDSVDLALGGRDTLTPPLNLRIQVGRLDFVNPRHYRAVGEEFFWYFKDLTALRPDAHVLDAGCGCGQMAVPLTRYLDQNGRYEGFDIVEALIGWCQQSISPRFPNFHFEHVDVFNATYNPGGGIKPSEFRFPYEDETFDFVFAKSLFTHMLPEDMENYLREVSRVLKKGGNCLITFFLLNQESFSLVAQGSSTLDFSCDFGRYRTIDPVTPERAIAYEEAHVRELLCRYGLQIGEPIRFGSWCGRMEFVSYQDMVIARK